MENTYVAQSRIREAARLTCRTCYADDGKLRPTDPALYALTDFQREYPITVDAGRSVRDALHDMTRLGVHALLVTRPEACGTEEQVLGLVTAFDIRRARPSPRRNTQSGERRSLICVQAVMTVWDDLSLANYESLQTLCALDLYEAFQGTGLTHLLVIEYAQDGSTLARGLVSRASLARRLGRGAVGPNPGAPQRNITCMS